MESQYVFKTMPFGRYRGKPLAKVVRDRSYLRWLLQEPDIQRRYPNMLAEMKQRRYDLEASRELNRMKRGLGL
ncbi:hypothetical protein GCM10009847_10700 [Leucobacter tardus]|uniref:Uncharacterized protein n=1 Tax=Leucobacter tardus TaxID=501483 RepID=A0A939QCH5_9MICO|nr:DUF3820 family protein [Leucobacter tardus]MBO2989266.1 hypothetical protein [Leucobacter tardus]